MALAWRNLFRNTRRTGLTVLVISMGLASLMFQNALLEGMFAAMISRATSTFDGHGQIFRNNWRETGELEYVLENPEQLLERVRNFKQITAATMRVQAPCMLSSPRQNAAITLYGIDLETEGNISIIDQALTEGKQLAPNEEHQILIGWELADLLEVGLGDRLVAAVSLVGSGELSQELYRVKGIFQMGERSLDRAAAMIPIQDAQKLVGIGKAVHQIVVKFSSPEAAASPEEPFWASMSDENITARNWLDLSPSLEAILSLTWTATLIILVFLASLVIFIIMNTLFMGLFERLREFGILRAIGTRPFQLANMILLEAGLLGLISIIGGTLLGLLLIGVVSWTGIDYGGIDVGGVTLQEAIYPRFGWLQFTVFPVFILIFTVLAAIYPSWVASRILPVKAMHKEW